MTLQDAFCVECGAQEVPLQDGVCRQCALGDRPLLVRVQDEVRVEVCKRCGAEHRGDSWRTREDATEAYDRAALDACRVHEAVEEPRFTLVFEQAAPRSLDYVVGMEGRLWGEPVEAEVEVRVEIKPGVCRTCSRQAGGYYEAVLQIRPPKAASGHADLEEALEDAEEELARMRDGGHRQAFVSRRERVHGGVDLYVGDYRAARNVARKLRDRFGAQVGESTEQVGMKDGQPVMRASVAVRLPAYAVGDFVVWDGELWRVDGFTDRLVALSRLPDGRRDHVDPRDETLEVARRSEEVRDAVVVSAGGTEAQVLDPETMETVTVPTPGPVTGETVPVVRWDGRLRVVPP